ncbi:MAG: hypothetical protein QOC72_3960 [Methylobacteriaceae bacterium]|jgi:hypothetical protein|nr:hypothetical protein [Methylobacteriaceae bacterium]
MTINVTIDKAAEIGSANALLMDIARRLQLSATRHKEAEKHFNGLAAHVDRQGSPLQDLVAEVYPSGSFAIHAATLSRVKRDQYDVDAVLELLISPDTDPQVALDTTYEAIKGERGSQYFDYKIERNSRCVTVHYPDGVTVDLMPVVRLPGTPERVARLFHHKPETGDRYHKDVNPKGFANYFNTHVEVSEEFASQFESRRLLVEHGSYSIVADKAETQPMPDHLALDQKSPRVVALQLLKRFRDIRFRKENHRGLRKPPSVVKAAIALEAGPVSSDLTKELLVIASALRNRLTAAARVGQRVEVRNPAYWPDVFTDRWPESNAAQSAWITDLTLLLSRLERLRAEAFDPDRTKAELAELFGETAASYALEKHFEGQRELNSRGRLRVSQAGRLASIPASVAAPALITPARANTNMGERRE